MFAHSGSAFWAGAQRLAGAEVDQFTRLRRIFIAEVKLELVVFGLFVELDHHFGRERPAGLGSEAVKRPDAPIAQELLDLLQFEGTPGGRLAERKAAALAGSVGTGAGVAPVVFLDHAAAVGAGRMQGGVIARDGVLVVALGLGDDFLGHGLDLCHELVATELAFFHQGQTVLPFAGQIGTRELLGPQATQQRHQLEGLGCGDQFAPFAQEVFFVE